MDKSKRPQIIKLSLIASLFIITPIIPTFFRPSYFYIIFNLFVVALVAEAGLISFFSESPEDQKHVNLAIPSKPCSFESPFVTESKEILKPKVVEKCSPEEIVVARVVKVSTEVKRIHRLMPSIFFIGNGENEPKEMMIEEDEVSSRQELFTKAEIFIGKFHNQLKLQRQVSWNRIHPN